MLSAWDRLALLSLLYYIEASVRRAMVLEYAKVFTLNKLWSFDLVETAVEAQTPVLCIVWVE